MTQQVPVLLQQPQIITQKVQLTLKLFLLESARSTLEQELRNFTNQAYEEVRSVLNSSCSTSVFTNLTKALDVKYQKIAKLSASLKGLGLDPQVCFQPAVKNRVRANHLQPFRIKGTLITDFLKFGPMLRNSLLATSVAKASQVLRAAQSHQPLKHFLSFQPASVQQDDMSSSNSSRFNKADCTQSSSCHMKGEEQVVFKEKSQSDSVCVPPAIAQNHKMNEVKPQILLPPLQAVFPVNNNPKQLEIWAHGEEVQVQHQKQTSFQLLHFLRIKSKTKDAPEVTFLEWNKSKYDKDGSDSPQQLSPIKTRSCLLEYVATDKTIDVLPPKTHTNVKIQTPVFRVKRVNSSGTLVYSCVIATETELWDIGDVFVEALDSLRCSPEREECQNVIAEVENSCVNIDMNNQDLQSTGPEQEDNPAHAEMQTPNSVKIPEFQFRTFEEIEVMVSHIVSPDNFYIQHIDSADKLQALVTDNCKGICSYAEKSCVPDIGTLVLGWFPQKEQWCRAQVMKICGVSRDDNAMDGVGIKSSIKLEVKRLDYGDTFCLSLWNIKELHPEMTVLPLQALQVSLANVTSINGRFWSEEAVGWLKAMVYNRTLYARLYPQGPKVTVELFLEKGKLGAMRRGASLSLRLAQNGHARHNELKNAALIKQNAVQLKKQKQDSDWEKYLISCYTQIKK